MPVGRSPSCGEAVVLGVFCGYFPAAKNRRPSGALLKAAEAIPEQRERDRFLPPFPC